MKGKSAPQELERACDSARKELHEFVAAIRGLAPQPVANRVIQLATTLHDDVAAADADLVIGIWPSAAARQSSVADSCARLFPGAKPRSLGKGTNRLLFAVEDGARTWRYAVAALSIDDDHASVAANSPFDARFDVVVISDHSGETCRRWLSALAPEFAPDLLELPDSASPGPLHGTPFQFDAAMRRKPMRRLAWFTAMVRMLEGFLAREVAALAALEQQLDVRLTNLREMRKRSVAEKALALQQTVVVLEAAANRSATRIEARFLGSFEPTNIQVSRMRSLVGDVVRPQALREEQEIITADVSLPQRFEVADQPFVNLQRTLLDQFAEAWCECVEQNNEPCFAKAVQELDAFRCATVDEFASKHRKVLPAQFDADRKPTVGVAISESIMAAQDELKARLTLALQLVRPPAKPYERSTFHSFVAAMRAGVMQWTMPLGFLLGGLGAGIAVISDKEVGDWVGKALGIAAVFGAGMGVTNHYQHKTEAVARFSREFRKELEEQIGRSLERLRASTRGAFAKLLGAYVKNVVVTLRDDLDGTVRVIDAAVADRERMLHHRKEAAGTARKTLSAQLNAATKLRQKLEDLRRASAAEVPAGRMAV